MSCLVLVSIAVKFAFVSNGLFVVYVLIMSVSAVSSRCEHEIVIVLASFVSPCIS